MPLIDGLSLCMQIKNALPLTAVIIMTAVDHPTVRDAALRAGASALVLKFRVTEDLLPAIDDAFSRSVLSPNGPESLVPNGL